MMITTIAENSPPLEQPSPINATANFIFHLRGQEAFLIATAQRKITHNRLWH